MTKGSVKWFDKTKGYGFIQPEKVGADDIFVHMSALERSGINNLKEGQHIEYDTTVDNRKGRLVASRLTLIQKESQ